MLCLFVSQSAIQNIQIFFVEINFFLSEKNKFMFILKKLNR